MAVLGGQVLGQKIYGRYPMLNINANDDVNLDWSFGRGQYIPTTATEQMAATLGRWLGLPATELNAVFPNLANFPGTLDFLPLS